MPKIIPVNPGPLGPTEVDDLIEECQQYNDDYQREKMFWTRQIGKTLYDKIQKYASKIDDYLDMVPEEIEEAKGQAEFILKMQDRVKLPDPNTNINHNWNNNKPARPSRPDVILSREEILDHGRIMLEADRREAEFKKGLNAPEVADDHNPIINHGS